MGFNSGFKGLIITLSFLFCSQLHYEVESTLMSLHATKPEAEGDKILSMTKHWNKNPDTTGLLLQDWRVISFFKKYLTEWDEIVKSLHKKNACAKKRQKGKKKNGKTQAP